MLLIIVALVGSLILVGLILRGGMFLLKYSEQWANHARPRVFPRPTECPRCEQPVGRFERLRSFSELVLGGWTCPRCGSEFDQLDNIRLARAWNANLRDLEQRATNEKSIRSSDDTATPVQKLFED